MGLALQACGDVIAASPAPVDMTGRPQQTSEFPIYPPSAAPRAASLTLATFLPRFPGRKTPQLRSRPRTQRRIPIEDAGRVEVLGQAAQPWQIPSVGGLDLRGCFGEARPELDAVHTDGVRLEGTHGLAGPRDTFLALALIGRNRVDRGIPLAAAPPERGLGVTDVGQRSPGVLKIDPAGRGGRPPQLLRQGRGEIGTRRGVEEDA